jgi:pilus assembly protein CpaB
MREQVQTPSTLGTPESTARVARRLGDGGWRNGRLALGVLLVLTAVLGGAAVLRQADRTVTVLAAGRDLPSGVPLRNGDLHAVRVRLPAEQLARYARPADDLIGQRLTGGLPKDSLIPIALVAASPPAAGLVEYAIPVRPGGIPGELRPGDRVAVIVAREGASGRGVVLLPTVEVIRLHQGGDGFAAADTIVAVEVRMPKERLAAVAGAVATGQVSLARLAPGDIGGVEATGGEPS